MEMVDPPEGWKYGFPKPFDIVVGESLPDWYRRKGYPQELINQGMLGYVRHWYEPDN